MRPIACSTSCFPAQTGLAVAAALFTADSGFSLTDPIDLLGPLGALLATTLYPVSPGASIELEHHPRDPDLQDLGNLLTLASLADGDEFYLFAAIIASADGAGRFADAFSTVSLHFAEGGNDLAVAAVALPPGAWLFGSGLAGLLLLRRRTLS